MEDPESPTLTYYVAGIGTRAGQPKEWMVGVLPLDAYLRGDPILGQVNELSELFNASYQGLEYAGGVVHLALHLNHGSLGNRVESVQPDAVFQTQTLGIVDFQGAIRAGAPSGTTNSATVVSSIAVKPSAGDAGKSGYIDAFRVRANIAAIMNPQRGPTLGHPSRRDPHFLLFAHATQPGGQRSLWSSAGIETDMPGESLSFDEIKLGVTLKPWNDTEAQKTRSFAVVRKGRMTEMIRKNVLKSKDTGEYWLSELSSNTDENGTKVYTVASPTNNPSNPAYWGFVDDAPDDALDNGIPDTSMGYITRKREWGVRIGRVESWGEGGPKKITRLLLHYAIHSDAPYKNSGWRSGPEPRRFTGRVVPGKVFDVRRRFGSVDRLIFTFEQRISDVDRPFALEQAQDWVWTLQPEEPKRTKQQPILDAYNAALARIDSGRRGVRDTMPLSTLPSINGNPDLAWRLTGILTDRKPWIRIQNAKPPDDANHTKPSDWTATRDFDFDIRSLEPLPFDADRTWWVTEYTEVPTGKFSGALPRLISTLGEYDPDNTGTPRLIPCREILISAPAYGGLGSVKPESAAGSGLYQPSVSAVDGLHTVERGVYMGMRIGQIGDEDEAARTIEIGALRFRLSQESAAEIERDAHPNLVILHSYGPRLASIRQGIGAKFRLPVESVLPGGQDPPATGGANIADLVFEGIPDPDQPLVFSTGSPAIDTASYSLSVTEMVARDADHKLALSLLARIENSNAEQVGSDLGRVFVIDPRPFRFMAIDYAPPSAALDDEDQEVAIWNSEGLEGPSWQVQDVDQSVRVTAPPAVLGEAMEKTATFDGERPRDIEPDRPAAARIGPATRIEIDPTFQDQKFREPGWNLRRILGYPGQRSAGSRLKDLRLELAYGLTARLRPETDVWLAEIAAIYGAAPPGIDDTGATEELQNHIEYVRLLLAAESNRIAVDKLWSGQPDAPLRLTNGTSFRLRRRDIDEAGKLIGGPETPFRWPIGGDIKSPLGVSPQDIRETVESFSLSMRDGESFPGGLPWAFESANILLEVYGTPDAIDGSLADIHLSALGGWGGQRARFALGKSIIETETTQGRMHRYKLERLGRIGGLWNRAKHVIIYERTTAPPRQFYNKEPIGKLQDEHLGRPILRKVEEFVEILEPLRKFPENGSSFVQRGFLTGAEFKSVKIRVDSRWGSDVRREGWQVPLWNSKFEKTSDITSGPIDPDDPSLIYPKPQVFALFAGEDGGEVKGEIDEPQKLVFYTSTLPKERDDTDAWKAVRDIDFIDLPSPTVSKIPPSSAILTDAILPAEPPQIAGWESLTLGLVPSKQAVALMHARGDGPASKLRNFTISRSSRADADERLQTLNDNAASLRTEFDFAFGKALAPLEKLDPKLGKAEPDAAKDAAVNAVKSALESSLHNLNGALAKAPLATTKVEIPKSGRIAGKIKDQLRTGLSRLEVLVDKAVDDATDRLAAPAQMLGSVSLALDQIVENIPTEGEVWDSDIDLGLLAQSVGSLIGSIFEYEDLIRPAIDAILLPAQKAIDGLDAARGRSRFQLTADQSKALTDLSKDLDKLIGHLKNDEAYTTRVIQAARRVKAQLETDAFEGLANAIGSLVSLGGVKSSERILGLAVSVLEKNLGDVVKEIDASSPRIAPKPALKRLTEQEKIIDPVVTAWNALSGASARLGGLSSIAREAIVQIKGDLSRNINEIATALTKELLVDLLTDIEAFLEQGPDPDAASPIAEWKENLLELLNELQALAQVTWIGNGGELGIEDHIANAGRAAKARLGAFTAELDAAIDKAADEISAEIAKIERLLQDLFNGAMSGALSELLGVDDIEGAVATIGDKLAEAIDDLGIDVPTPRQLEQIKARIQEEISAIAREAEEKVQQLVGTASEYITDTVGTDPASLVDRAERLAQQGSETLRLLRAVGDPPESDRLGLNRPEVAYILNEVDRVIDITPAISLVNRVSDTIDAAEKAGEAVGDILQQFGVRLPTSQIGERFIPDELRNLSVGSLLPDMAGLDLQALLGRVGFPDLDDSDAIRISEGFDKATRRAWLKVEIDVPFTESVEILNFGPVKLMVDQASFNAVSEVSAGPDGTDENFQGRISGDWRIVSIGQDILTFRQTGLHFDESGKLDFRIAPERVELAPALEFLTNFLAASGQGGGLVIEPLMRGVIPSGVKATLDVALPNLTLGVFSITDLNLHVAFGIAAIPEFEILSELSVGQRMAPFTITVWILNGGGYVTQRLNYRPLAKPKPALTYTLDIGVVAGVGLFFNFGVVSGGVSLQVGCSVAVTWTTVAGGNTTTVTVFLLARGNVDVAGLVTASIALLLEVSYDGSLMLGRGTLRLSFKISTFYTLRVNQSVEYVFQGEKRETNYSDNFV